MPTLFFKAWHLLGTIRLIVALPLYFPPIGIEVTGCESDNPSYQFEPNEDIVNNKTAVPCPTPKDQILTVYYSVFSALQGFGWAASKIAHLSLVPVLALNQSSKLSMTSFRYVADIMGNLCLHGGAWIFLHNSKLFLALIIVSEV